MSARRFGIRHLIHVLRGTRPTHSVVMILLLWVYYSCQILLLGAAVSSGTGANLLVRHAMGGDLHDVRVVLGQPRIDTFGVCF